MATKPKRWPINALRALEDTLAILSNIDSTAREAQTRAVEGDFARVVLLDGDIRGMAQKATLLLMQAKLGEYE